MGRRGIVSIVNEHQLKTSFVLTRAVWGCLTVMNHLSHLERSCSNGHSPKTPSYSAKNFLKAFLSHTCFATSIRLRQSHSRHFQLNGSNIQYQLNLNPNQFMQNDFLSEIHCIKNLWNIKDTRTYTLYYNWGDEILILP